MQKKDITKENLYEAVKTIIECDEKHIQLSQQKLFTLFSIGFQYMLFRSTKHPGHYIIRIEDSQLLDKLQRKAKDDITRKFLTKLALPRKLKYDGSTFHLDFFNVGTWASTKDLDQNRIQGALIVKNTSSKPMDTEVFETEEDIAHQAMLAALPEDYYLYSLKEFVPKTITIAYDKKFDDIFEMKFPFIKDEEKDQAVAGVKIASDVVFEKD